MNIALIFAGGIGQRMNTRSVPKQFLRVNGKPIIIHTLEVFEKNHLIDAIVVSCVQEYINVLYSAIKEFGISKVKGIVPGGETGQLSIKNGLEKIANLYPLNSIVLIHDGVRPLIDNATIDRNIESVKNFGSAVTVTRAAETIGIVDEKGSLNNIVRRQNVVICRAPQSFILRDVLNAQRLALESGIVNMTDTASLMQWYGKHLAIVEGPIDNIKITTQRDFYTLKSLFDLREFSQLNEVLYNE